MRHTLSTLLAVLGITAVFAGFGSVAFAQGNGPDSGQVCANTGSGWQTKVDVSGEQQSVTVTAPSGYLISAYCVSGGDVRADVVTVNPPAASVTIVTGAKYAVSHYQIQLVPIDTPPPPPPPTTTTPTPTTPTPTTTTPTPTTPTPTTPTPTTPTPTTPTPTTPTPTTTTPTPTAPAPTTPAPTSTAPTPVPATDGNNGGNNGGNAPEVLGEQASSNNNSNDAQNQPAQANPDVAGTTSGAQTLPTAVNAGLVDQPEESSGLLQPALLMLLGVILSALALVTSRTRTKPVHKR